MGEIADAIVDGEICQICCCPDGEAARGYPFTCAECGGEELGDEFFESAVPVGPECVCPECGKTLKSLIGVMDHMRDKHGKTFLGGGPDD